MIDTTDKIKMCGIKSYSMEALLLQNIVSPIKIDEQQNKNISVVDKSSLYYHKNIYRYT